MIDIATAILLLSPLAGSFINGLRWKKPSVKVAGWIGVSSCFISFICSLFLFFSLPSGTYRLVSFFNWFDFALLKVSFAFLIDSLSVSMLLVITGVGFLIHLFSVDYMSHDNRPAKYFSYLNLFVFSMITLVLGDNLLLMFLGWEGVGLCSYLLIGFWFTDQQKAGAGMKAFIVNRIGDIGFLLGIFILFYSLGALNFLDLSSLFKSGSVESDYIKWALIFLFIGAVGKSAQIPLYIWLPFAMAGPTPVSALIHAATMVTAGIYLIVRLNFLFVLEPFVLSVIGLVGAMTAFVSALVACAQRDIKKVLAYSTISQLGYMFTALGIGAFSTAMFHLITHAFFKALLFLGAGSIIHALKGEQDIHKMGGLKSFLPVTWLCFLIGFLALIGLPPFAGFFSKDEILWYALAGGNYFLFSILMVTAFMTTFYMSRLFVLVFHGQKKSSLTPKESGLFAKIPLISLATLSAIGGVLGVPHLIGDFLSFPHLLEKYLKSVVNISYFKGSYLVEAGLMIVSSLISLFIMGLTFWLYLNRVKHLDRLKNKYKNFFSFLEQAFKVDAFCYSQITKPFLKLSGELWQGVEKGLIEAFIEGIKKSLMHLKDFFEILQNGKIQRYIWFMLLGLIFFIVFLWMG